MLVVLLIAAATYRITRLVNADAFPPIAAVRSALTKTFGDDSSLAYLLHCPWCASPYIAAAVTWAVDTWSDRPVPLPALTIAAASAVAGFASIVTIVFERLPRILPGEG